MDAQQIVKSFFTTVIVDNYSNVDANNSCLNNDRSKYWDRVKTYSILRWPAKPNCVSPIICARFGWESIKSNMLKCVSCKKILSATLPDAWEDYYDKALQKLVKSLSFHHEDYCSWKSSPTPNYVFGLPHTLGNDSYASQYFNQAITSLITMEHLPRLDIKVMDSLGASIYELKYIYSRIYEGVDPKNVHRVKFTIQEMTLCVIALCGWMRLEKYQDILECNYCQRHAGIWNYSLIDNVKVFNGAVANVNKDKIDNGVMGNGIPGPEFVKQAKRRFRETNEHTDPNFNHLPNKKIKMASHIAPHDHDGLSLRNAVKSDLVEGYSSTDIAPTLECDWSETEVCNGDDFATGAGLPNLPTEVGTCSLGCEKTDDVGDESSESDSLAVKLVVVNCQHDHENSDSGRPLTDVMDSTTIIPNIEALSTVVDKPLEFVENFADPGGNLPYDIEVSAETGLNKDDGGEEGPIIPVSPNDGTSPESTLELSEVCLHVVDSIVNQLLTTQAPPDTQNESQFKESVEIADDLKPNPESVDETHSEATVIDYTSMTNYHSFFNNDSREDSNLEVEPLGDASLAKDDAIDGSVGSQNICINDSMTPVHSCASETICISPNVEKKFEFVTSDANQGAGYAMPSSPDSDNTVEIEPCDDPHDNSPLKTTISSALSQYQESLSSKTLDGNMSPEKVTTPNDVSSGDYKFAKSDTGLHYFTTESEVSGQRFDPLSQHRSWCPWITSSDSDHSLRMIGCKALYSHLKYMAHNVVD